MDWVLVSVSEREASVAGSEFRGCIGVPSSSRGVSGAGNWLVFGRHSRKTAFISRNVRFPGAGFAYLAAGSAVSCFQSVSYS